MGLQDLHLINLHDWLDFLASIKANCGDCGNNYDWKNNWRKLLFFIRYYFLKIQKPQNNQYHRAGCRQPLPPLPPQLPQQLELLLALPAKPVKHVSAGRPEMEFPIAGWNSELAMIAAWLVKTIKVTQMTKVL